MDFDRIARQYGIPIGLILIKLLVTLRTGIDTFNVSADILDVLVIDGVYLVLWLIASYSGKSQTAMALRPFAAGGAWILYLSMIYIAVAAGKLNGMGDADTVIVSVIARLAGGILLLYDTYDYISALFQMRQRDQSATWKDTLRQSVGAFAYLVGALLALPVVLVINAVRAVQDYGEDDKNRPTRARVIVHPPEQYSAPQFERSVNEIDTPIVAQMQALVNKNPKMSKTQIADELDISRTTLYKYWDRVKVPSKNGHN